MFERTTSNPIITPRLDIPWKAKAVYNPAAIFLDGKVHIIYRGQAQNGISCLGYAVSGNGVHIDDDLQDPILTPREEFEHSTKEGWNSGCEDPRITQIGEKLYLTYTAYDGTNPPRVALTSISVSDFLARRWNWEKSKLISPPGVDDKDACIVKKENDGYYAFHRLGNVIWIDDQFDPALTDTKYLTGSILAEARADKWDNVKIGIAAPPIQTSQGWILFYHAVSNPGFKYKIGAMLLDPHNPKKIVGRSENPLLEPIEKYETEGQIANVVFSCGAVVIDGIIYMYYGGADTVLCVATMKIDELLSLFIN